MNHDTQLATFGNGPNTIPETAHCIVHIRAVSKFIALNVVCWQNPLVATASGVPIGCCHAESESDRTKM